jgi:two-component system sensor histidine kinase/response regulator
MNYRKRNGNPLERMLTVDEVAYTLHVHPTTVRKWAKLGHLKAYRLGTKGNVRFKTEDISSFSDSTSPMPMLMGSPFPNPIKPIRQDLRASVDKKNNGGHASPVLPGRGLNDSVKKSLAYSEEKFARIFSSSPVAFSITRLKDNVVIEVNDNYCRTTGHTREEIIGSKVSSLNIWVNPGDREKMLKTLKEQGRVVSEEYLFRNKAGQIHPVLLSVENIVLDGEDCLLLMTLDISKRKNAEESLQQSEIKYRNLFENAKDAVVLAEADTGIIADINPAGCKMLGLASEQITGKPITILHPPEMADRFTQIFREHVEKGLVDSDDSIIQRADGTCITASVTASVSMIGGKKYIQGVFRDMSAHNQADQALKDSEERFAKAFNASGNAICITSTKDNKFIEINEAYLRFTGYTREEVIGHTAGELKLWVIDNEYKKLQEVLAKSGNFQNMEFHSRCKSGEIRTGLGSAELINIGGKPCRIVVITDITERKKTEEALKDSEEKFSKVFDFSAVAICIASLKDNMFLEANESFMKFTGYTRAEVIGHSSEELNLWVKPDELKQWLETLQKDGHIYHYEFSSRKKNSEIRVGLASAEVITIGGEPCRIVVITDITDRKNAEETLRFSDTAFKSIHEGVIALDTQEKITYWNDISEELFNVRSSEAVGKSLNSILQPIELYRGQGEELRKKLEEQGFNRTEMLYNTPHDKVWVDMTVRTMEKDGKKYGRVITASDISERKRMEQELAAYRTHLEEIVEKRTSELSTVNQRLEEELEERKRIALELIKAKEIAEGASRTKGDFLARMSHEIRTPIHGVLGTLNLLLEANGLKDEQRQYATMARASGESLLGIINDILDFSKIEAGQLALEEMEFDLQSTVEEAFQPMALPGHKKGLELVYNIAPDVPLALIGDANRLRQVIVNLLGNGVKFTEHGEVCVSINLETAANDRVELHFIVRDTGIGIPHDKQKDLFNPFVQANGSKYGGTGLGLAICRQLTSKMDGRIWVDSEPGAGSSFHFTAQFRQSSHPQPSSAPSALIRFRGTPVLVVNNNASARFMLTSVLNGWGFHAVGVEDETAALTQLSNFKDGSDSWPVVLMDLKMPGTSGIAIARKMGDNPALKKHIIMMLTCDSISDDFARCQEAGIPVHLVKPIKKRELQDVLAAVLGATRIENKEPGINRASIVPELKLRILVAEDNPTSQIIARKTLEKMGCTVQIAGNGVEATRMAQQGGIDLVLMDFEMPEMNGLEATRIIRGKEKDTGHHLPIIAMTAYAMKQDRDKCFEVGMDGYLTKPVSPENLYKAIKGLMPQQAQPAATPVVDLEAALRTVGGDKDILKEVLQVFLTEDSPKIMNNIKEALQHQDTKALKAEGHGMKGAASAMGGKSIAAAAARLESAALSADFAGAQKIHDEICVEIERFKDFYANTDLSSKGEATDEADTNGFNRR